MTNRKTLTVGSISRCTSSHGYESHYSTYPKIKMDGKWLMDMGFQIGDKIEVEYSEGVIRISRLASSAEAEHHEDISMVAESRHTFNQ